MGRNVKWDKKLSCDWPRKSSVQKLGEMAADFLDTRINEQGLDADGRQLPALKGRGWYWTDINDPRADRSTMDPRNEPGKSGPPAILVDKRGYRDVKAAKGGKPWKGSSFTGAMWKSLTVKGKSSKSGVTVKLYFAGSVKVGGGKRFRNRDKARLLQYADRASGQGFEPAGKRQFELMAFSSAEKLKLAAYWLQQCRLVKPA